MTLLQDLKSNFLDSVEDLPQIKTNPFKEKEKNPNFERFVDVVVPAVVSKSGPPFGPALAQAGVNVTVFCEKFNEITEEEEIVEELEIPVKVFIQKDKTCEFLLRSADVYTLADIASVWFYVETLLQKNRIAKVYVRLFRKALKPNQKGSFFAKNRLRFRRIYKRNVQKRLRNFQILDILDLYKIFLIKYSFINFYSNVSLFGYAKTVIEYLYKFYFQFWYPKELETNKVFLTEYCHARERIFSAIKKKRRKRRKTS
jgi:hypothetical protein